MIGGWLPVEEQHVTLDAVGVEDAGRQSQKRVDIALVEELASASPSALTNCTDDFRPKGGSVITTSEREPGSDFSASLTQIGDSVSSPPMPWSSRFMAQSRAVASTISHRGKRRSEGAASRRDRGIPRDEIDS